MSNKMEMGSKILYSNEMEFYTVNKIEMWKTI